LKAAAFTVPVMRPHRDARHRIRRLPPFPLLDHVGIGFHDQHPHAREGRFAPSILFFLRHDSTSQVFDYQRIGGTSHLPLVSQMQPVMLTFQCIDAIF
jgi:hypothetical protein